MTIKSYDIQELYCPVDNLIIKFNNKLLPILSNYLNESDIYCISILFTFLSGVYIKNDIKILPGIFFFLGYFFNILYIHYLQEYKNQKYIKNNIFDLISYIYILTTLYKKNHNVFIIVFILMILNICNWGCKNIYIKTKYPDTYEIPLFNDLCGNLCPFFKNPYIHLNKFGDGSLSLIISIYLAYI